MRVNDHPATARNLLRLLACLGGIVLLGCLLSPPLYWTGSWLAEIGVLPIVEGFPFHRYFSRSIQIATVLMLWPAFRWIGIRRLEPLGIQPNARWKSDLALGFAVAAVPAILMSVGLVWGGVYQIRPDWPAAGFLRIAGTAAAVSVIEEFLFRAVLLGLCLMAMRTVPAILLGSLVFAVVHFLRPLKKASQEPVTWLSGFEQIPLAFTSAPPWPLLGWGFATLFLAGILLAGATVSTRSLFIAIGVHAGWIATQQGLRLIAKFQPKPAELLPLVGDNVVSGAVPTGLLPLAMLAVTGIGIFFVVRHGKSLRRPA
jgi:membrane protease YdiL (CAAX protease family)